jgi:hypothetical protein
MSTEEERKSKTAEELESIAEEIESEMEERDETRLEDERAEREDLNQGMATGTHDSTHRGVNWPPSYRIRRKAAKPNQGPKGQAKDSDSKT